jgi:hypothetical protein
MPDPTTPPTEPDGDKLTMGSLKKMIQDTVAEIVPGLIGSAKPPTPAGPAPATDVPTDIAAQVRAQVERIRKQEEKQKTEAQVLADIAALKDAKPVEKVPVQRSKLHKVMGWGDPPE